MKRLVEAVICAVAVLVLCTTSADAGPGPWFRAEKVRCLSYLYPDKQSLTYVPQVKRMGLNCALVIASGKQGKGLDDLLRAADRSKLRLLLVDYWNNRAYTAEGPGRAARRYVGADGNANPRMPCPADAAQWQAILERRALEVAALRRAGHPSVCGLLMDIEDYSGTGDQTCGGTWFCYCDTCFDGFVRSAHLDAAGVRAGDRQAWLARSGLLERYRKHQDAEVVGVLRGVRKRIDAVAPDLLLATYPWPEIISLDRQARVQWDIRFAQGLGTGRAPFMLFSESTYMWGYDPATERRQADLKARGLHYVAVTGYNMVPSERLWWPEEMATSARWASARSDGYWIYVGHWPLLDAPAGRPISGTWGDRAAAWVRQFTQANAAIASGKAAPPSAHPLAPLTECFQLSDLYNPKATPGRASFVRRWRDIGLPWQGGELAMAGKQRGDWLGFERAVSTPDRYEISAWLTTGPDRPIVRLEVDGKPAGEPVDLYDRVAAPGDKVSLGFIDLASGNHAFRIVAASKNPRSTGYDIGLRAAAIQRVGNPPSTWSVIGPFDNAGSGLPGYETAYPPEREIALAAAYPGKGGQTVRWSEVAALADGYLDLLPVFSDRMDAVAYCLTYVYSPADAARTILLGSDDGAKLFVNGECVWGEAMKRSARRDEDAIRVRLRRGWNTVLCKVIQATGGWGLYLRVYDPQHELRFAPTPQTD